MGHLNSRPYLSYAVVMVTPKYHDISEPTVKQSSNKHYEDDATMTPVVRPQGWKAGASGIDKAANRLLIGIGVSLFAFRFVHATLYAEKWRQPKNQRP